MNDTQSINNIPSMASSPLTSPCSLPPSSPPPWSTLLATSFPPPTNPALNPRRRRRDSASNSTDVHAKRRKTEPIKSVKLKQIFDLLDSFRWSIEDLMVAIFDEAARTDYLETRVPAYARASMLKCAYTRFPKEKRVSELFSNKVPDPLRIWAEEIVFTNSYQEMSALVKEPAFGKYSAESISTNDLDLTLSLSEEKDLAKLAPTLMGYINTLTHHKCEVRPAEDGSPKRLHLTLASLCNMRHPQLSNNVAIKLGLCLYGSGIGRRALDLLAGQHICASYRTTIRRIGKLQGKALKEVRNLGRRPTSIVTYDNFEFREGRRDERLGDHSRFRSITTAMTIPNRLECDAPLHKTMWRPREHLLDVLKIMDLFEESQLNDEVGTI